MTRKPSNRFLPPEGMDPRNRLSRAWGASEMFPEGQWQSIRVVLERQGWNHSQIERVHDQLRQGWPLEMAKRNVSAMTGSCPMRSRRVV